MPLREFYCENCNYTVRRFDRSVDVPTPICIVCEKEVIVLISRSHFRLRGFGWASDGYSKDIDDAESFWARDGKPVLPHTQGKDTLYSQKKEELVKVIEKGLKKS